jgi:hypothetical protein
MTNNLVVRSKRSDIFRRFLHYASTANINLPVRDSSRSHSSPENAGNDVRQHRPSARRKHSRDIAGTKGIIWAVDAEFPATEYFRSRTSKSEIGALKSLFTEIREKNVGEFLGLTKRRPSSASQTFQQQNSHKTNPSATQHKLMKRFIKSQKDIKCTIVSNGIPAKTPEQSLLMTTKSAQPQEHDKTARAIAEVLSSGGLPGSIVNTSSLPNEMSRIRRAITHLRESRVFLELTAPSRPSQTQNKFKKSSSSVPTSPLAASYSIDYGHLSRPSENPSPMSKLLSEIRAERVEGEHRSRVEHLRLEELGRKRDSDRYQPLKSTREINPQARVSRMKDRPLGLERAAARIWGAAGLPDVLPTPVPSTLVTERRPKASADQTENKEDVAERVVKSPESVFEKLAGVLATTSERHLSPQLSMPASNSSHDGEGDYHPRWQYTRWHTKRANRRR